MSLYYPTVFPIKVGSTLILDQAGDLFLADMIVYQHLIRKLIYLACGTQPDIAFIVGQLSRQNSDPRVGYLCMTKQVLQYLKETNTVGIIQGRYPAGHQERYEHFGIVGYVNSSYARDIENRNSIIGYSFFFGGAIIIWYSEQPQTVLTSISEAEYVVISHSTREDIWI